MKQLGQWLVFLPSTIGVLIWAVSLVAAISHPGFGILAAPAFALTPFFIFLGILGGALWLAGWIAEGFAKDPNQSEKSECSNGRASQVT